MLPIATYMQMIVTLKITEFNKKLQFNKLYNRNKRRQNGICTNVTFPKLFVVGISGLSRNNAFITTSLSALESS